MDPFVSEAREAEVAPEMPVHSGTVPVDAMFCVMGIGRKQYCYNIRDAVKLAYANPGKMVHVFYGERFVLCLRKHHERG